MSDKQLEQNKSTPGGGTKHRTRRQRQPAIRVLCWVCLKDLTIREQYFAASAKLPPVCSNHWEIGERVREASKSID